MAKEQQACLAVLSVGPRGSAVPRADLPVGPEGGLEAAEGRYPTSLGAWGLGQAASLAVLCPILRDAACPASGVATADLPNARCFWWFLPSRPTAPLQGAATCTLHSIF